MCRGRLCLPQPRGAPSCKHQALVRHNLDLVARASIVQQSSLKFEQHFIEPGQQVFVRARRVRLGVLRTLDFCVLGRPTPELRWRAFRNDLWNACTTRSLAQV
jgi:hypothetical protein